MIAPHLEADATLGLPGGPPLPLTMDQTTFNAIHIQSSQSGCPTRGDVGNPSPFFFHSSFLRCRDSGSHSSFKTAFHLLPFTTRAWPSESRFWSQYKSRKPISAFMNPSEEVYATVVDILEMTCIIVRWYRYHLCTIQKFYATRISRQLQEDRMDDIPALLWSYLNWRADIV